TLPHSLPCEWHSQIPAAGQRLHERRAYAFAPLAAVTSQQPTDDRARPGVSWSGIRRRPLPLGLHRFQHNALSIGVRLDIHAPSWNQLARSGAALRFRLAATRLGGHRGRLRYGSLGTLCDPALSGAADRTLPRPGGFQGIDRPPESATRGNRCILAPRRGG